MKSFTIVMFALLLCIDHVIGQEDKSTVLRNGNGNNNKLSRSSGSGRARGERRIETVGNCADDLEDKKNICAWDAPGTPRYAVCATVGGKKQTLCLKKNEAGIGFNGGKGKGDAFKVDSCGCCAGDTCKLPVPEPKCDTTCDSKSSKSDKDNKPVQFCYFGKGKGNGPEEVVTCGDPYSVIEEEKGDILLSCGSTCSAMPSTKPSAMPSSQPSTMPSSMPSDACLACDGKTVYRVNELKTSWENHSKLAKFMGCSLASITSAVEQSAALTAILAALSPVGGEAIEGNFVWIGGSLIEISSTTGEYRFEWLDGSGEFTGSSTGSAYTNWFNTEEDDGNAETNPNGAAPNGEPYVAISLGGNYWVNTAGKWVDRTSTNNLAALYKCCEPIPQSDLNFQFCTVSSDTHDATTTNQIWFV